jgi:CheY-like chemotaxis protein
MKEGQIIIIDDSHDEHFIYERTLTKVGVNQALIFFDNGIDALNFLKKPAISPFLILCDINMPGMNGLELRELMCKDPDLCLKNTPFIFMSTSASSRDISRARGLYTHGFFNKNPNLEQYEATIRLIVNKLS